MPLQTKMRIGFGVLVILLFAWTGWQALEFARLARYLPVAMSGLGVVIGILTVTTDVLNYRRQGAAAAGDVPETAALHGAEQRELAIREGELDPDAEDTPEDPRRIAQRSVMMFGWVAGYALAIWVLGILAASALFLLVFLLVVARSGWVLPVVGTALMLLAMVVLSEALNLYWPSYLLQDVFGALMS
jgi:hypothetical protein